MTWQNDFQPEGLPDANATGQSAAQNAGIKPVAAAPPPVPKVNFFGGGPSEMRAAAPEKPSNQEPDWRSDFQPMSKAEMSSPSAGQEAIDKRTKAAAEATARIKKVADALGQPFEPSKGEEGFVNRAAMGFMNNSEDRANYLQNNSPAGTDVRTINVPDIGSMVVFKPPGDTSYHPIRGNEGSVGDLGDIAAEIPAIATQVGLAAATNGTEAAPALLSPIGRMFIQGVGGAGERLAEQEAARASGYNSQPVIQDVGEAARTGMVNAAAEGVGSIFSKALRGAQGTDKGLFTLTPEEQGAVDAQQRLGAPNFTLGQVREQPFAGRETYLSSLNPILPRKYEEQNQFLTKTLDSPDTISDSGLQAAVNQKQQEATAGLANPGTTMAEGGEALQAGLQDYLQTSTKDIGAKYDMASDQAKAAQYNISPIQKMIAGIKKGIPVQGAEQETPSAILDASGQPLTTVKRAADANAAPSPSGDLQAILNDISTRDPNLGPYKGNSGYDQLKNWRTRVGDYIDQNFQNLDPAGRANYRFARQLYEGLTEAINNPASGAGPQYAQAIKAASDANAARESFLDMADVQSIKKTGNPADALSLAKPGNAVPLQALQKNLGPDKWKQYQDSVYSMVASKPEKIEGWLGNFRSDPDALNAIMPPARQAQLLDYSSKIQQIKDSLPAQLLAAPNRAQALVTADGTKLKDFVKQVGLNSPMGEQVRNTIRQGILQASLATDAATKTADPTKLVRTLGPMLDSGKLAGVLTPAEISQLQDIRTYASKLAQTQDSGASIAAGEKKQAMFDWLAPRQMIRAWAEGGLFAGVQSRSFANPGVGRFFFGGGKAAPLPLRAGVAAAGADVNRQMDNNEPDFNIGQ